ncbi:hypothetical protein MMC14_006952 [Varicellaria rhodocarpa]|nr:hypothetical protein [Varicellaria rhodocarpa]
MTSDILPALSGLVQEVGASTGAKYYAGLWYTDDNPYLFIKSLLWRPFGEGTPANNGSPSWSWSSFYGAIYFYEEANPVCLIPKIDPIIHNVTMIPAYSDAFGQLRSGMIILEGMTRPYYGPSSYEDVKRLGVISDIDPSAEDNVENEHFVSFDIFPGSDYWSKVDTDKDPHILLYLTTLKSTFRGSTFQCFLLLKDTGSPNHSKVYKRIGRAYTSYEVEFPIRKDEGWDRQTIALV